MATGRSDEELMARFRDGSRRAFEELFARHHRGVVRFCRRMTGDPERAEEAAQEIFLRVARAAPGYEPTARFTTWLYTIARRTTLNVLRDGRDPAEAVPGGTSPDEGEDGDFVDRLPGPGSLEPEQAALEGELKDRLLSALAGVPEGQRAAFVLARGEGLSYEETAAVLGISVGAVKSRVFRAREILLDRLSGFLG